MISNKLSAYLFGDKAKLSYLLFASLLILFTLLGTRDIWTQEHRWADIVSGMIYRNDYLHPYLGTGDYYDKPLLSYWFIIIAAKITHTLTTFTLRLPSAIAGFIAICSIYSLGKTLHNQRFGLICGWMLLTTFYFIFWARTSSADMLNLAGSLLAVAWYFHKRNTANFFAYFIFFLIIAITSLCKGLIGAIIPLIAVVIDMAIQKTFKKHLRWSLFLAMLPALLVYLLPFIASSYADNSASYQGNGLYLVYRENILRYFKPFDHQGPIYTYFLYLPIYLIPWAVFLPFALYTLPARYKNMSANSKSTVITLFCLFLFLTLSGSRRSYYILPVVPFAIIFIADWLTSAKLFTLTSRLTASAYAIFLLLFCVATPWYYSQFGMQPFVDQVKRQAETIAPWQKWNIVLLDAESKLNFYLNLPPQTADHALRHTELTEKNLLETWPMLKENKPDTIFISREQYQALLSKQLTHYLIVKNAVTSHIPFINNSKTGPIAYIAREGK